MKRVERMKVGVSGEKTINRCFNRQDRRQGDFEFLNATNYRKVSNVGRKNVKIVPELWKRN